MIHVNPKMLDLILSAFDPRATYGWRFDEWRDCVHVWARFEDRDTGMRIEAEVFENPTWVRSMLDQFLDHVRGWLPLEDHLWAE